MGARGRAGDDRSWPTTTRVSVAQELLARRGRGALAVELDGVHLLNGGVYPDLHRPQPVQTALLDPEQGPQISAR